MALRSIGRSWLTQGSIVTQTRTWCRFARLGNAYSIQQRALALKPVHGPFIAPRHISFAKSFTTASQQSMAFKTFAFYKFCPIDKESLPKLQALLKEQFTSLGILGRIYIASEGINAQLSCPQHHTERLAHFLKTELRPWLGEGLELNEAVAGNKSFIKLHVRIRDQLVADGLPPKSYNLQLQPNHLSPAEWHQQLATYEGKHGKKPILIDMRNHYESEIGYFKDAIRPPANTFRGSVKAMQDICYPLDKQQDVYMYCTGGIRCSKAGAILRSMGHQRVHLVKGGITAYGRWIKRQGEQSLFTGKNFTFDTRLGEPVTDDVLGQCHLCGEPDDTFTNCINASCNLLIIVCNTCKARFSGTCGRPECVEVVRQYREEGIGRAVIKQGETEADARVLIKPGRQCEHEHQRRVNPRQVLGQPGDIVKAWNKQQDSKGMSASAV